jgi:DNA helicase-2/ATP-dependent DNA helicase PcrA
MLAIPVRGMWVGTFHGLCNRFLRAHWKISGLPQGFQILDASDQAAAVKRVVKAMNLDEERHQPKQLAWAIASAKDDGMRPKDIEVRDEQSRVLVQVYEAYDAQCQREGVVDFAELMLRTYELMRDNTALREHYQRRFRHILVDEFQDTNRLQYAWLKMFAGPPERGAALFCVGDDDQSIYAFRGAQVGNMAAFEREYRVKTVVKLERNYRSYGNILDAANELISKNSRPPRQEPAHRGRPRRAGPRPRGARATTPRRSGSSRRRRRCTAKERRAERSRCSTAATRRAG